MISAELFVASKSYDEAAWLEARRSGITATTAAKAMTPAGYLEIVETWALDEPVPVNAYMRFGLDQEGWLALWAKELFGTMPNDWLIRHPEHEIALATPDGLSLDHSAILEVKTTGKDWTKPPLNYYRQVQWQLYVTGANYCVFVWLLREERETPAGPLFVPAWLEPKHSIIDRDDEMISAMVETADRLWAELGGK